MIYLYRNLSDYGSALSLIIKDSFESILARAGDYMDLEDLDLVRRSYEFAVESIRRYKFLRFSGDPAIVHPLAVADQLITWKLDAPTVAAGILHDTIEDPNIHPLQIQAVFDYHVTSLVDGVTKLKKFEIPEDTDADTAYYYKIFLAVAEDIRVALIKIADRMHNLRTLKYLPSHKRIKNCFETLRIFVPLTSFLGMDAIREEMEDITFEHLQPDEYLATIKYVESILDEEDKFFDDAMAKITNEMVRLRLPRYIRKFSYSVSDVNKIIETRGPDFPKTGLIEITAPDEESCYIALRAVHSSFQALSNGFQDTITFPSIDLKRMIETNVLHPSGRPLIVRIVSSEMKDVNRWGVIPYLGRAGKLERSDFLEERVNEIKKIVTGMSQGEGISEQESIVEIITRDLLQKNIFVITTEGKRIELPRGSTVLDFAYKMGRETGDYFYKAYLNSRESGKEALPESCDQLGITVSKSVVQDVTWLECVNTPSAKMYIKRNLAKQSTNEAMESGKKALVSEFISAGLSSSGDITDLETLLAPVAEFLDIDGLEAFYVKVGYGDVTIREAINVLREQYKRMAMISANELEPVIAGNQVYKNTFASDVVKSDRPVKGAVSICETCSPVPGDIIEIATSSRKNTIHRKTCKKIPRSFGMTRVFNAEWGDVSTLIFPGRIKVKSFPNEDVYREVLEIIEDNEAKMVSSVQRIKSPDGLELMEFLLEVDTLSTLNAICAEILSLKDVIVAKRI